MKLISFCFFILVGVNIYSQNSKNIYLRFNLYDYQTVNQLKENYNPYFILTPSYIDSNNDNEIEYDLVKKTIIKWFPNVRDSSYLIIDWERQLFKNLKKFASSGDKFINAENSFVEFISYIKKLDQS